MTIILTALERETLDECLTTYMSDAEGLDYTNGNPIVSRKAELELDLSSVAKRKFAIYVAATLESMIAPDSNSGWSSPKSRREACLGLAAKIDAAVDAANGVEFTASPEVPLPCVAQGCHPNLTGLVALPDAPNGEYLPEPPDAETVSCDGFSCNRYDQMSIDDGVEMLRAMGAVALQLHDDLKTKTAATDEAKAKIGIHLAMRFLPGIEFYRHLFKQHNGEPEFRLAECKGIEELVKKLGIPPATVRTWRQRYRHLPEYRAALEANAIPIEESPERIRKCDSCGTRIKLPEGQEPDHDENCSEHPMRRESLDAIRDAAVRAQTYERLILGTGRYAMLPADTRSMKIQELAQGTPVSDVVELDDFSVLLNRIRGQEMDEMLTMVEGYYAHQRERLSILGIELVIRQNSEINDITSP